MDGKAPNKASGTFHPPLLIETVGSFPLCNLGQPVKYAGEMPRPPHNFFEELKRRNVYQAAIAYAVFAWFLIQVATQVLPFFEIPNWVVRLVVLLLIVGFPITLVISWAFELTPEGFRREEEVDHSRPAPRKMGRRITALIVALATVAAGLMVYRGVRSRQGGTDAKTSGGAAIESKSIAVLPFENLSAEKANAYFAEGIQDEILTRLSKVADLKVIAHTSTQHYESVPGNLPEIARQLGVAHILEGSVRKVGEQVRVNVQLIRAADDSNVWAETYNRKLVDIFSVESEVAKAIADQLRVHLTGKEEEVIAAKPTNNPDAYDAYLRGLAYTLKTQNTPGNYLGAQKYFREAVRLDPKFALSWALLSYVDARGYRTLNLQPTEALREEARRAFEIALSLQPHLGEAWVAKGYYHYGCLNDFETAVSCYEKAREFLPNSSRIPESLAFLARDRGHWEQGESYFNEAERLDPRNVSLLTRHGQFYITLRRFPEALQKFDLILTIAPDDIDALVEKTAIAQAEGDLARAAALAAPLDPARGDPTAWETLAYQAILERHPEKIIPRFKELLAEPAPELGYLNGELRFWLGWLQEFSGDTAGARQTWQAAHLELEGFLKGQPDNPSLLGSLALVSAGLGDKPAAFKFVESSMAVKSIAQDAANGPQAIDILARVAAQTGEPDRAVAALQRILSIPCNGGLATGMPLTPALLRLDPMFDPLRNDPRFQKLADSSSPK